jgi:hypothetical protein
MPWLAEATIARSFRLFFLQNVLFTENDAIYGRFIPDYFPVREKPFGGSPGVKPGWRPLPWRAVLLNIIHKW